MKNKLIKKLGSYSLLYTTFLSFAVVAESSSSPKGFYAGIAGGLSQTNIKANCFSADIDVDDDADEAVNNSGVSLKSRKMESQYSATGGTLDFIGGYNYVMGSVLVGAEVSLGYDFTKKDLLKETYNGHDQDLVYSSKLTMKKGFTFGFAPRVGYLFSPNVLFYAKLGILSAKQSWTFSQEASWMQEGKEGEEPTRKTTKSGPIKVSQRKIKFAPGLGFEYHQDKMFIRVEYSYILQNKVKIGDGKKNDFFNDLNANGIEHSYKPATHLMKIAIGYKF